MKGLKGAQVIRISSCIEMFNRVDSESPSVYVVTWVWLSAVKKEAGGGRQRTAGMGGGTRGVFVCLCVC